MEKKIKIRISDLTDWFVNIQTTTSVDFEGKEIVTDNHAVSYMNSPLGRERLQNEQPENIVRAIFEVWGDVPTEKDPQPEAPQEEPPVETE